MKIGRVVIGKKLIIRVVLILLIFIGIIYSIPKIKYALSHESTDDAYVHASIIPLASEVDGKIIDVYVGDNSLVKKGEILLKIEDNDYKAVVEQKRNALESSESVLFEIESSIVERKREIDRALAELEKAEAELFLAKREESRYSKLLKEGLVSQSDYDKVKSVLEVNNANIRSIEAYINEIKAAISTLYSRKKTQGAIIKQNAAELVLANIDLSRTTIYAPVNGRTAKRKEVDSGKFVSKGDMLFSIVNLDDVWVEANFKESQLGKMRIGQKVKIKVDAYPDFTYLGHIDSFQPGAGAIFSLLPPEDATGNFVKVVRRVPVRINIDTPFNPNAPLWPGLSVVPSVNLKTQGLDYMEEHYARRQ